MSQKTDAGQTGSTKSHVVIIGGLVLGVAIILALVVLRKSEQREASVAVEQTSNLILNKFNQQEIHQWIVAKMQRERAKVGVVNIWATWCEPCRDEMPELAEFQKTNQAPLFLISADSEIDEPNVRSFLRQSGVDFESSLLRGDQQEFIETWQRLSAKDPVRQWSMTLPATFLVNASGQVISFTVGTATAAELGDRVKKSLDTAHD